MTISGTTKIQVEEEVEKGDYKASEEEGNNGKDTDGDQCQLGSNCKSNDGETEVNYLIIIILSDL